MLDERLRQVPSKRISRCEPAQRDHYEASWRHDHNTLADLADYEWLTGSEGARYLDEIDASTESVHRLLAKLRKSLSAQRAGLVLQQVELRRRAIEKFGELAAKMFFTDISLQQATDLWTARYKASRMTEGAAIVDYCTGIGGDLLALAERGSATGWDNAAEIVLLANANLRSTGESHDRGVSLGNVEDHPPTANEIWHLDPDRRADGRRSTQLQWHSPGPEVVDEWRISSPNGALKLAPATTVPTAWQEQAELEWITRDRQCRQQVVWFGDVAAAPGQRRATSLSPQLLPHEQPTFVGSADVVAPIAESIASYVYDTDPSIRAAGLTGAIAVAHELSTIDIGAAYLTSDQAVKHPLLTRFEVLEQLPLRNSTLSKHLKGQGIGQLEIKKRGVDTDPERLRKQLKLRGDGKATLILTRLGEREIALLARRDEG